MQTYPFNDESMFYDYNTHRYYLTEKCALDELGINLALILNGEGDANSSTLPQRLLRKVSDSVYNWIYADSMNHEWLEFIMAFYAPLRDTVKEMLKAQLEYVLTNGFVNDYSGVNISKGQTVDINWLRGRVKIADEVEMIANRFIPGLGYSLKYLGQLPCVPCKAYHAGY